MTARPAPSHAPRSAPAADAAARPPLWEELFRAAPPERQREWLDLARRQGVLYAHQVVVPSNGPPPAAPRQLLPALLHGQATNLEPVRTTPVEVVDAALDERQREAVARALQTPDVCLIQGLPGTGKSRVVAEIVTQAARRGQRVLLLAPSAAALDRVLEQVGGREGLFAVRSLGRDESANALPAEVRSLTQAERLRFLRDEARQRARQEAAAAERHYQRRLQEELLWPRLLELAERRQGLDAESAALQARHAAVPSEVERAASVVESGQPDDVPAPFAAALKAAFDAREQARAAAEQEQQELERQAQEDLAKQEGLRNDLRRVQTLAEARRAKRPWSPTFWRSLFQGDVLAAEVELLGQQQELEQAAQEIDERLRQAVADGDEGERRARAERTALVEAEVARRRSELDDKLAALDQERHTLDEKWQAASREFDDECGPLPEPTPLAVAAAQEGWRRGIELAAERKAFARQWADYLDEHADGLAPRLLEYANLVAATTAALPGDPHFGDATGPEPRFDLLVLEEADQVTESEFLNAARRARRWVLVGEPGHESSPPPAPAANAGRPRQPARSRGAPPAAVRTHGSVRPGFFQRLWQQLHCEPRRRPPAWVMEQDRLCCRLRPLVPADRQFLETERVADSPDIELRILTRPQATPALAEVVFPPATDFARAKEFIFRELDELRVCSPGRSLSWVEGPDQLILRLADVPAESATAVPLAPGVRVMVARRAAARDENKVDGVPWYTCCVEFDRQADWPRERAEEWVERYLGLRDLGRTVRLDVPHRMQAGLARVVSDLCFDGAFCCPDSALDEPAVEFVPVPPLGERDQRRARPAEHGRADPRPALAARVRALKGGAGLEIDLGDARHCEHLPSDLRPCLPDRGLVNYLEAQAVVRVLEGWLVQSGHRTAGEHASPNGNGSAAHGRSPARLVVLALFAAQAELIRQLIKRSAPLAANPAEIIVDVPASFRQRECDVLLVSLTRSHTHRAVSFGDGPHALALALTRARGRLVLFGDPGTLVRRSQWAGPVDHLDEAASRREREWAARLVAYLTGRGGHPRDFHLREGPRA